MPISFSELEPTIDDLVRGVEASTSSDATEIPILEGEDNGAYTRLCNLALSLGELVADDDVLTGQILTEGRRGLRKQMWSGVTNFVKQGPPLEMTATLAHEQGHRYTEDVYDMEGHILSEVTADGTAFVVCRYFDLDISARSFPYIAGFNHGVFTPEMLDGIQTASTDMILRLQAQS